MKISRLLLLAASAAISIGALALPARPVSFVFTQPDGSTVTLRATGDERCHYVLTDDDQVALLRDGACYFATIGADGRLAPSRVLAADRQLRNAEQRAFVEAIKPDAMRQGIAAHAAASPLQRPETSLMSRASENTSAGQGRRTTSTYPLVGEVNCPVILVEYADYAFSMNHDDTYAYFNGMLNTPGFSDKGATGSAHDYFKMASNDIFKPKFDVLGPVTLPEDRAYYGGNNVSGDDKRPWDMVVHAVDILSKQGVDFSKYDNDGDGKVDNVFVFYAGYGEAQMIDDPDAVWPHSYELSYVYGYKGYKVGETYVDSYACANELLDRQGTLDGIGTFVHEYTHTLGLPDLYNTADMGATYTPNAYDLLDMGSYNNTSRTPPTYSAWERNALGWIDLEVIDGPGEYSLDALTESGKAYIILTSKKNEFFILENRQLDSWDKYIPYHGMLIWHIDFKAVRWNNNTANNQETHQLIDLEEAGGITKNLFGINYKKYPFPGTANVTEFTDTTSPGMLTWNGTELHLPITNIQETNGVITFTVGGESGIVDIDDDDDYESPIYNLQGIRIDIPRPGQLYLQGGALKVNR